VNLADLFGSLFDENELRAFITHEYQDCETSLPGRGSPLAVCCSEIAALLKRRGHVDSSLFTKLRTKFPKRRVDIDTCEGAGDGSGSQESAAIIGAPAPDDKSSHLVAREIVLLSPLTTELWTEIARRAHWIDLNQSLTRLADDPVQGFDVLVPADSATHRLWCAKAPRTPLTEDVVMRANLVADLLDGAEHIIVSLDDVPESIVLIIAALQKKKKIKFYGVETVLRSLQPTSEHMIRIMSHNNSFPSKIDVLIHDGVACHLITDPLSQRWFHIETLDGNAVPESEAVVQAFRVVRPEFRAASYRLPIQIPDLDPVYTPSFDRRAYLDGCKVEFQVLRYHAHSLTPMRPDERLTAQKVYVESEAETADDPDTSSIADQLIDDQLGPVAENALLREHLRKQIMASIGRGVSGKRDQLRSYFETHPLLAIVGDPGSGKSISIRIEIIRYCDSQDAWRTQHTPVFVSLAETVDAIRNKKGDELLAALFECAATQAARMRVALTAKDVSALSGEGRLALFLDGFDEITEHHVRLNLLEAIENLARTATKSGARIVLTSRPGAVRNLPLPDSMKLVSMSPFTRDNIRQLAYTLVRWASGSDAQLGLGAAESRALEALLSDCESKRSILDIARNPFMLTMLVGIYLYKAHNHIRKYDVFNSSVELMLFIRNRTPGQHVPSKSDLDRALSRLAVSAIRTPGATIDAVHASDLVIDTLSIRPEEAETLIRQADNAGILTQLNGASGAARTGFRHYSLLEYFAALAREYHDSVHIQGLLRSPLHHNVGLLAAAAVSANGNGQKLLDYFRDCALAKEDRFEGRGLGDLLSIACEVSDLPGRARKDIAFVVQTHLNSGSLRSDAGLRQRIGKLLGELLTSTGDPSIWATINAALRAPDPVLQAAALDLVGGFGVDLALPANVHQTFMDALDSGAAVTTIATLRAVAARREFHSTKAIEVLQKQLLAKSPTRKFAALEVVESAPSVYLLVVPQLHRLLQDPNRTIAGVAGRAVIRGLAESGRVVDVCDPAIASVLLTSLEAWGSIARPGSARHIRLEVPIDDIRKLLRGTDDQRRLGIRLLPWVAGTNEWAAAKVRDFAIADTASVEQKLAGLAVLTMRDSPRTGFQEGDFLHVDDLACGVRGAAKDRRLRIAALRAIAATRGSSATVERLRRRLVETETQLDHREHVWLLEALTRAGRNDVPLAMYIHQTTTQRLERWSNSADVQKRTLNWIHACQDMGITTSESELLCAELLKIARRRETAPRVRNVCMAVWARLRRLDRGLIENIVADLSAVNTDRFEPACYAVRPVVERVRSSLEFLHHAADLLKPLRHATECAASSILGRCRGDVSSDLVETTGRYLSEIDQILFTMLDYGAMAPASPEKS
jgi:hypothetical protein